MTYRDGIETITFEQGNQGVPVDGARIAVEGGHIEHGELIFKEVGYAAGHFLERLFQRGRIGFVEDRRNSDYRRYFDIDRFTVFVHKMFSACAGMPGTSLIAFGESNRFTNHCVVYCYCRTHLDFALYSQAGCGIGAIHCEFGHLRATGAPRRMQVLPAAGAAGKKIITQASLRACLLQA